MNATAARTGGQSPKRRILLAYSHYLQGTNCWNFIAYIDIFGAGIARYSDWLRAERMRAQSSSAGRIKNFLFSKSSRSAVGPTQVPIQG
jgi:hypothetical protein